MKEREFNNGFLAPSASLRNTEGLCAHVIYPMWVEALGVCTYGKVCSTGLHTVRSETRRKEGRVQRLRPWIPATPRRRDLRALPGRGHGGVSTYQQESISEISTNMHPQEINTSRLAWLKLRFTCFRDPYLQVRGALAGYGIQKSHARLFEMNRTLGTLQVFL